MTADASDATPFVPAGADLARLARAAARCHGCELYRDAERTVFGEGPAGARVVLVGEQPGDQEDRQGHPFVGPAGRLLDKALEEAGVDRGACYVTNAVKHFRFVRTAGKPRLHKKPDVRHIRACHPWLAAELSATDPAVVVALGAVAVRAVLGTKYRVTADRGRLLEPADGEDRTALALITTHPSAVLRAPGDARDAAYRGLVDDLRLVAGALEGEGR
jgi:uracil-DNA glycosylase family protein